MTLSNLCMWTGAVVWAVIVSAAFTICVIAPLRAFVQSLSRLAFEVYCIRRAGRKLRGNYWRHAARCVLTWTWEEWWGTGVVVKSGPHTWDGSYWYGKWDIAKKRLDES